ncbi:hypothetical protein B296_00027314 [Ensete ventricosum]|uniref:Uncharacterized protein n=1 Tax=Ensete ventricosum TaxID=4639 RepID=A0A426YNS6_ENSVE|nr:hypothetical protein B296_00027314 [Ensete ventricosum]
MKWKPETGLQSIHRDAHVGHVRTVGALPRPRNMQPIFGHDPIGPSHRLATGAPMTLPRNWPLHLYGAGNSYKQYLRDRACLQAASEEERRLWCNVDTGTGHLGHPPHPHFCAVQATRSSGCGASTCWRVDDAPAIGVAGHLESLGEAKLGGLDNIGLLQLSRRESLISCQCPQSYALLTRQAKCIIMLLGESHNPKGIGSHVPEEPYLKAPCEQGSRTLTVVKKEMIGTKNKRSVSYLRLASIIEIACLQGPSNQQREEHLTHDADTGTGNLDRSPHPRSRAVQTISAAGCKDYTDSPVRRAFTIPAAGLLEPLGEASLFDFHTMMPPATSKHVR